MQNLRTVAANNKLTFCLVLRSKNASVFALFHARAHYRFYAHTIGRHDHTSIIDCFLCRMEERGFREVVSDRRARQALAQTN